MIVNLVFGGLVTTPLLNRTELHEVVIVMMMWLLPNIYLHAFYVWSVANKAPHTTIPSTVQVQSRLSLLQNIENAPKFAFNFEVIIFGFITW